MFDEQYPEDDEHAECRHEIQTLSAEIERVKAERDRYKKGVQLMVGVMKQSQDQANQFAEDIDSLKSRLPVNADGDVPTIDDNQFMIDDEGQIIEFFVESIHRESGEIYLFGHVSGEGFGVVMPLISQCHSTAESCAAHEGKEGEKDGI